jgi:hypothetical protein
VEYLKQHPLATLALGVVLGIVFAQQLKKVPGVSKIPSI